MLTEEQLRSQLGMCLKGTDFSGLGEKVEGKVRDSYLQEGKRVIVTTDRLSAFDRIITTIPFKGQVLNQMAKFWFENTGDIVGNHAISFPDPNVTVGRECEVFPVEFVVRGYLTGSTSTSAWKHYEGGSRNFCGNALPDGMVKNQKFEKAILTPSTKADKGDHDESVSREVVLERGLMTAEDFDRVGEMAMKLYARGVEIAAKQGIILVDTKYEFGKDENGEIVLVDEIHTPDSSRFWYQNEYDERLAEGREQKKIDKEYVRLWLSEEAGFVGDGEVPVVPDEVRVEAARRYIEAYELITGREFVGEVGDAEERVRKNLGI